MELVRKADNLFVIYMKSFLQGNYRSVLLADDPAFRAMMRFQGSECEWMLPVPNPWAR